MNRRLAAILLLSGALKVTLALVFADLPPRYDEAEFLAFGRAVAAGDAPVVWRAPGYQAFIAFGLWLGHGSVGGVRVLQALVSVLTTWLVWRLARRRFGERAALGAAAFLAFYPSWVAYSHLLWAETLFLPFVVLAFDRVLAAGDSGDARAALAGGVALGLAALVRSTALVMLAVSVVWLLARRGPRFIRAAALLAGAAAIVVAPWSAVVSARAGRLVIVDTNSGYNFWSGNNRYIPRDLQGIWSVGLPPENGVDEAWGARLRARGIDPAFTRFLPEAEWRTAVPGRRLATGTSDAPGLAADEQSYRREALEEIRADPAGFLARVPRRLAALWSPDFFLPRHLLRDWYGPASPALAAALVLLTWLAAAVPLLAGPGALLSLPATPFRSLSLAWIGTTVAAHAVTYGHTRMHQPLVPFLVLAVAAFASLGPARRLRLAGVVAIALALAGWIVAAPIVAGLYIAPGPRHVAVAEILGASRHLPVPGTRWAAWGTASAEVAAGHPDVAERILAEPKDADEPWSLWLRALATPDRATARMRLDEALVRDPGLEPARILQRVLAEDAP